MKRPQHGSTPKQYAYAMRKLNGDGESNKEIARLVGFSPSVANNTKNKIERTAGYHNAMKALGLKTNNLMLALMSEFESRGVSHFDTKELFQAIDTIGKAWDRFSKEREEPKKKKKEDDSNPLSGLLYRDQPITIDIEVEPEPEPEKEVVDLDF